MYNKTVYHLGQPTHSVCLWVCHYKDDLLQTHVIHCSSKNIDYSSINADACFMATWINFLISLLEANFLSIPWKTLNTSALHSKTHPSNLQQTWYLTYSQSNQENEPLTRAELVPCSTPWPRRGRGTTKHDRANRACVESVVVGDCRGLWNKEQVDWWLISCGCLADWDSLAAVTLMNYTAEKNTLNSDYCQRGCECVCVSFGFNGVVYSLC